MDEYRTDYSPFPDKICEMEGGRGGGVGWGVLLHHRIIASDYLPERFGFGLIVIVV